MRITKNFTIDEMRCKCGCGKVKYDLRHMMRLQLLRDTIKKPIIISSGYRCLKHNRSIGSKDTSQHIKGTATDIKIKGMKPDRVADLCEKIFDGVGRYDTFTHVDSRGMPARWDMRTEKKKRKK